MGPGPNCLSQPDEATLRFRVHRTSISFGGGGHRSRGIALAPWAASTGGGAKGEGLGPAGRHHRPTNISFEPPSCGRRASFVPLFFTGRVLQLGRNSVFCRADPSKPDNVPATDRSIHPSHHLSLCEWKHGDRFLGEGLWLGPGGGDGRRSGPLPLRCHRPPGCRWRRAPRVRDFLGQRSHVLLLVCEECVEHGGWRNTPLGVNQSNRMTGSEYG